MKRELLKTADGSMTIRLPEINEQYHSKHGALQEAKHVFIKMGLTYVTQQQKALSVMEIGFGTGLNALLTCFEAQKNNLTINYTAIEAYPVLENEWKAMEYEKLIEFPNSKLIFKQLHLCPWEQLNPLFENFSIHKQQKKFEHIIDQNQYNLIYFDAFGARVQPELWTEAIFKIMYVALKNEGVLVTYSAKGSVRRALQAVGFTVQRLEGPPGKREMLRAIK